MACEIYKPVAIRAYKLIQNEEKAYKSLQSCCKLLELIAEQESVYQKKSLKRKHQ
jgi:hypothetical protein